MRVFSPFPAITLQKTLTNAVFQFGLSIPNCSLKFYITPSWGWQSGDETSGGSQSLVKVQCENDLGHFLIERPHPIELVTKKKSKTISRIIDTGNIAPLFHEQATNCRFPNRAILLSIPSCFSIVMSLSHFPTTKSDQILIL